MSNLWTKPRGVVSIPEATHAQTRAHNASLVLRAVYDLGPIRSSTTPHLVTLDLGERTFTAALLDLRGEIDLPGEVREMISRVKVHRRRGTTRSHRKEQIRA